MATTEDLHKAMIHLCLAVEQVADALESRNLERSEANARHARELVNAAHRQMALGGEKPLEVLESS